MGRNTKQAQFPNCDFKDKQREEEMLFFRQVLEHLCRVQLPRLPQVVHLRRSDRHQQCQC